MDLPPLTESPFRSDLETEMPCLRLEPLSVDSDVSTDFLFRTPKRTRFNGSDKHRLSKNMGFSYAAFATNRHCVGGSGIVDKVLENIVQLVELYDPVKWIIDDKKHSVDIIFPAMGESAISRFALKHASIWSLESIDKIKTYFSDHPPKIDWVFHVYSEWLKYKTATDPQLENIHWSSEMATLMTMNPYELMLFFFTAYQHAPSVGIFIRTFVEQEGKIGAAFLILLHNNIKFSNQFIPSFGKTSIERNSVFFIPFGSAIVSAFYLSLSKRKTTPLEQYAFNYNYAVAYYRAFVNKNILFEIKTKPASIKMLRLIIS